MLPLVVSTITAVGVHPPDIDEGKIHVGVALFGSHTGFGRSRMVVEFNPESAQEFFGTRFRQPPRGEVLFIKRVEVLIQPPWIERIPWVEFGDDPQRDRGF